MESGKKPAGPGAPRPPLRLTDYNSPNRVAPAVFFAGRRHKSAIGGIFDFRLAYGMISGTDNDAGKMR